MDTLTANIQKPYFADIVAKIKKIEYREIKKYWDNRLSKYRAPFLLRLINGMSKKAPELTVVVKKVTKNKKARNYELHLGKIVSVKNWNIDKQIVKILSVSGVRNFKVHKYTKVYKVLYKKKNIFMTKRTANVDADMAKLGGKIAAYASNIGPH